MSATLPHYRFFSPLPLAAGELMLDEDEAHHLAHVLRLRSGDQVCVFDGAGCESSATVLRVNRQTVALQIDEPWHVDRESCHDVTIATSLPKGDRQKLMVEKLTELGVRRMIPLIASRGVAQPVEKALDRLRRGVIAASRQCGRNRLMEIALPVEVKFLPQAVSFAGECWFAQPDSALKALRWSDDSLGRSGIVAIGPEGGFAPDELEWFASAGWTGASLGAAVLRVETAAMAAAARLT